MRRGLRWLLYKMQQTRPGQSLAATCFSIRINPTPFCELHLCAAMTALLAPHRMISSNKKRNRHAEARR
jgi:hypothetical protein